MDIIADIVINIPANQSDEPDHRLSMAAVGCGDYGRARWQYELEMVINEHQGQREWRTVLSGDAFQSAPGSTDTDAARSLMGFLSLCEGDTDSEYFESYSPEALEWRDAHAEYFGYACMDWGRLHGCDQDAPEVDISGRYYSVSWEADEDGESGRWEAITEEGELLIWDGSQGEWYAPLRMTQKALTAAQVVEVKERSQEDGR